jgi:acetoin utilization deacetylase AcuC-like enzyme
MTNLSSDLSKKVTVFSHYKCLSHRGHEGSFESKGEKPERITALVTALASRYFAQQHLDPFTPSAASPVQFQTNTAPPVCLTDLWRVHSKDYIEKLLNKSPPTTAPAGKRGLVHFSPGYSGVKTRYSTMRIDHSAGTLLKVLSHFSFLSSGSLDAILYAAGSYNDLSHIL